jgi:hypothetical protein
MLMNENQSEIQEVADALMDAKGTRAKGQVLKKTRLGPTDKEKNKARTQRKAIKQDTGR